MYDSDTVCHHTGDKNCTWINNFQAWRLGNLKVLCCMADKEILIVGGVGWERWRDRESDMLRVTNYGRSGKSCKNFRGWNITLNRGRQRRWISQVQSLTTWTKAHKNICRALYCPISFALVFFKVVDLFSLDPPCLATSSIQRSAKNMVGTWFSEISSCSCLHVLPDPA